MTRGLRRLAVVAALGWAVAGCGQAPVTSTPPSPTVPAALPSPAVATPVATATPASSASPPGAGIVIDPALLGILPATVDDLPIVENAEAEAAALADPILPGIAMAAALALAVDSASGDFVYAVVVQLRPGALSDEAFRDWRDSFDEGACSQADGVLGRAETEIGGRTVHIGSCTGGLRTYHVWLEDRDVLISASSAGERRLGEILVENLHP